MKKTNFEKDLNRCGVAEGINGCKYKLTHYGNADIPAAERVNKERTKKEYVLGFNEIQFTSMEQVVEWVKIDAERELIPGVPLSERPLLEWESCA